MNLWECDHPGCKCTAVGVGGAIGLRAIGWYFKRGPIIRCPNHRPDKLIKAAIEEADSIQLMLSELERYACTIHTC